MKVSTFSALLTTVLASVVSVTSLGTSCSAPMTSGTAAAGAPYWLETIPKKGISAFHSSPSSYKVFRNVKDYGAKGDGSTDDTDAINRAISDGNRCAQGCDSSTLTPALVYFPKGTYLVSRPIVDLYYSQLVGDARTPPTLLAAPSFSGMAVIDANPYLDGGVNMYTNQNNFFRSIRNFVIDLRQMPLSSGTGLHWQVSQATSLINVRFEMRRESGTNQQGIFMENGSGGFMGDLTFNGGRLGAWLGNQQFTVRNLKIDGAQIGIVAGWNWGWTFQGVTITNCQVGFEITTGGTNQNSQTVGAEVIMDAEVTNTPIFVKTTQAQTTYLAGSLLLDNIKLTNVSTAAVATASGTVVLPGGTRTFSQWAQGNVYYGSSGTPHLVQSYLTGPTKPSTLLSNGKIFGRGRPTYADYATSQFVSVKDYGAKGDGVTDDTAAIQAFINQFNGCKIMYFDAGTYMVSSTITFPAGSRVVGEIWTQILGFGSAFSNINSPQVVVKMGDVNSTGIMEVSDMVFGTRGPAPGAIVVQWNVHDPSGQQGVAASWDTHIRLGSSAGTNLGSAQCVKLVDHGSNCFAAFLGLHLTAKSSAYLEGLWVWLGDHDLDGDHNQVTVFSGRGILSESQGPVWLVGTGSEHHVLYQYSFVDAKDHYGGLLQTESPYYQPVPAAPNPFTLSSTYKDPPMGDTSSWALNVQRSTNILVYGAGFYSFFQNYVSEACLANYSCQQQIVNIDSTSTVSLYSVSTVGTHWMLSINQSPVIDQNNNRNGFQSTFTAWTRNNPIITKRSPVRRNLFAKDY